MNKTNEKLYSVYINQLKDKNIFILLFLLIINIVLKTWYLGNGSIWLDEAHQLQQALFSPSGIWEDHINSSNGPFYTLVLSLWLKIFGANAFNAQLLSTIFAAIAACVLYLFAKRNFNLKTAIIAASLFTLSNWITYYSHEARGYTMILLMVILSFDLYYRIIYNYKIKYIIWYTILSILILFTHSTLALVFVIQFIGLLLYFSKERKRNIIAIFIGQFISAIFFMVWVLNNSFYGGGETTWGRIPTKFDIIMLVSSYLNNLNLSILYLVILLFCLIIAMEFFKSKFVHKIDYKKLFLFCLWAFFPIVAIFLISIYYNPRFVPRYMLYSTPGLYLLIGYVISRLKTKSTLTVLIMVIVLIPMIYKLQLKTSKPEQWDIAVNEYKKVKGEKSLTLVCASYQLYAFTYYYDHSIFLKRDDDKIIKECKKESILFTNSEHVLLNLDTSLYDTLFLFLSHNKQADPDKSLLNYALNNYKLLDSKKYYGVKKLVFDLHNTPIETTRYYDFENDTITKAKRIIQYSKAFSGNKVFHLNEKNLYGKSFKFKGSEIKDKNRIHFSVRIKQLSKSGKKLLLVYSINPPQGKIKEWHGFDTSEKLKINEWCLYEKVLQVSDNISDEDIVKFYLWNSEKNEFYIDDMRIEVL